MLRKTIGGDRLGSGNKMTVSMKTYERSTHDLSGIVRTALAAGTLVPFMSELALPGDTWDITLELAMMTHPTLGPLFGSYKVELSMFCTPIRLYNSWLHNNKLGIGMKMNTVMLPTMDIQAYDRNGVVEENGQINASSLIKYLGVSGIGTLTNDTNITSRVFNGVPMLVYWDIFKYYYANKQEDNAYVIHTGFNTALNPISIQTPAGFLPIVGSGTLAYTATIGDDIYFNYSHHVTINGPEAQFISQLLGVKSDGTTVPLRGIANGNISATGADQLHIKVVTGFDTTTIDNWSNDTTQNTIKLHAFPLQNIDEMRETILANPGDTALEISSTQIEPYNLYNEVYTDFNGVPRISVEASQEGLAVKTYMSDLLNNWVSDENQAIITTLSSVDTSSGSFTMDTLNFAQKMYNMYNRIAVSGGTYDDYIETVWTAETFRKAESPMYMGGLIKELSFQQIVSTATTNTTAGGQQPLGQLAGKGVLTSKHKGGQVRISVTEPSYITGIISLTPRIDYSQGNKWDMNLMTMDDFHKPELDEIGFQDLNMEQMAWYATDLTTGTPIFKSAGKQPAWVNYMTQINRTFSSFAEPENEMFMTLNRRYEYDPINQNILDVTTYIDPTKYNFIFAETKLDSQNFWAQVGVNAEVRRKMSAKLIPNL